jgi:hypothetical protein
LRRAAAQSVPAGAARPTLPVGAISLGRLPAGARLLLLEGRWFNIESSFQVKQLILFCF